MSVKERPSGRYVTNKDKKKYQKITSKIEATLRETHMTSGEIAEFRREMGMRDIIEADRNCLRCNRVFLSPDVRNIMTCDRCKITLEEYDQNLYPLHGGFA